MEPQTLPLTYPIQVDGAAVRQLTLRPPALRAWVKYGVPYREERKEKGAEIERITTSNWRALSGFIAEMARIKPEEAELISAQDAQAALSILQGFCSGNPQ